MPKQPILNIKDSVTFTATPTGSPLRRHELAAELPELPDWVNSETPGIIVGIFGSCSRSGDFAVQFLDYKGDPVGNPIAINPAFLVPLVAESPIAA
jgi:hypothetical protein